MSRWISQEAERLAPYTPGEQPQDQQYVKLNTNESPFPPSPKVLKAINRAEILKLNLYSDPTCAALTEAIARRYELKAKNVLAGNGSDEVLAFAFRAFCGAGQPVAFADVTYGFYKSQAALFDLDVKIIPLREDFTLHVDDYMDFPGTIVIANPNAPTGIAVPRNDIQRLLEANPDRVVIVDEAYVDFGAESCVPMIYRYDNLLVTQTMSKSRSLAGGRVGYALGSPELIADLNRVKYSFHKPAVHRGRGRRCGGRGVLRRLHRCHPADPGLDRGRAGEFGLHCPALPGQLRLCPPQPASRRDPVPEAEGERRPGPLVRRGPDPGLYPHYHRIHGADGDPGGGADGHPGRAVRRRRDAHC